MYWMKHGAYLKLIKKSLNEDVIKEIIFLSCLRGVGGGKYGDRL